MLGWSAASDTEGPLRRPPALLGLDGVTQIPQHSNSPPTSISKLIGSTGRLVPEILRTVLVVRQITTSPSLTSTDPWSPTDSRWPHESHCLHCSNPEQGPHRSHPRVRVLAADDEVPPESCHPRSNRHPGCRELRGVKGFRFKATRSEAVASLRSPAPA